MKALKAGAVLCGFLGLTPPAVAGDQHQSCSIGNVVGRWIFVTDVGQYQYFPTDGMTAIGTIRVDRHGRVSGHFDATFAAQDGFSSGVKYTGTLTIEPDCTGSVTIIPDGPAPPRTDTIAIVSDNEMWGMSQDPMNLLVYRARRISTR
jgi:hypothetical protein